MLQDGAPQGATCHPIADKQGSCLSSYHHFVFITWLQDRNYMKDGKTAVIPQQGQTDGQGQPGHHLPTAQLDQEGTRQLGALGTFGVSAQPCPKGMQRNGNPIWETSGIAPFWPGGLTLVPKQQEAGGQPHSTAPPWRQQELGSPRGWLDAEPRSCPNAPQTARRHQEEQPDPTKGREVAGWPLLEAGRTRDPSAGLLGLLRDIPETLPLRTHMV